MAENRRGKDRRFFFSLGQLVILGAGFAAASVVVFFLGMMVGQGIEERKLVKMDEPLVKIPVKRPAQDAGAAPGSPPKEELTFYDTLAKDPKGRSADARRGQEPARAEKPEAEAAARPDQGAEKTAEKSAPQKPGAGEAAASGGSESDQRWSVQVNSFPDEKSARLWVDRLKKKGYKAYMAAADIQGRTWYRVRVGDYATRAEAEKAEGLMKSKEDFSKAFATSQ